MFVVANKRRVTSISEQGEVYDSTSANPAALSAMELVRTIA
jgi:hypothetical protein